MFLAHYSQCALKRFWLHWLSSFRGLPSSKEGSAILRQVSWPLVLQYGENEENEMGIWKDRGHSIHSRGQRAKKHMPHPTLLRIRKKRQNGIFKRVLGQESERLRGVVGILRMESCLVKYTAGLLADWNAYSVVLLWMWYLFMTGSWRQQGSQVSKDSGKLSKKSYVMFHGLKAMAHIIPRESDERGPENEVGSGAFTISFLHKFSI